MTKQANLKHWVPKSDSAPPSFEAWEHGKDGISVFGEEVMPITYQSQCRDECVAGGINARHCEPSHGHETTTHGLDFPPFLSISTISYVLTTATVCEGLATLRVTDSLTRHKRWYHNTT